MQDLGPLGCVQKLGLAVLGLSVQGLGLEAWGRLSLQSLELFLRGLSFRWYFKRLHRTVSRREDANEKAQNPEVQILSPRSILAPKPSDALGHPEP